MSYNYYLEEEEYDKKETINNYWELFSKYEKEVPTLSDALYQMFNSLNIEDNKIKDFIYEILGKCKLIYEQNYKKIFDLYPNITEDNTYIISSFTCELSEYKYSPFIILHKNLVAENKKQGLENVSKYLYIFLKSLKKLPIIHFKQELYKFIQSKIKMEDDKNNKNIIPYKSGITKTFFGFTSVFLNLNIEYGEIKDDRQGTLFIIEGDTWGYDISLFNYFGKEKYLLEPEKEYIFNKILSNYNDIIIASCKIVKSPIIFENIRAGVGYNINKIELDDDKINVNNKLIYETYFKKINKYICKIKIEFKEREETMLSLGILCNIPQKKIKALITYNHIIDFDFLVNESILKININDKDIEINMKISRYKYTNEKTDLTIIEILDEDNIKDFIDLDESIESKDYINEHIFSIGFKDEDEDEDEENEINIENKNIEILDDKVIAKGNYLNKYYSKCTQENLYEGIIVLKDNMKLIGLIEENIYQKNIAFLPMNKIINAINFIKCKYLITKENVNKEILIYTKEGWNNKIDKR